MMLINEILFSVVVLFSYFFGILIGYMTHNGIIKKKREEDFNNLMEDIRKRLSKLESGKK